ncbi:hypothetical protein F4818DRAFT_445162 [Hypoxylon cercidicola]|nr:hypothetical protein F4818DRAFT_445162 [Hypoxylon cercidicola]
MPVDNNKKDGKANDKKVDPKPQPDPEKPKAPGVRCKPCWEKGIEQWLFSGRDCPKCGTYAP